MSLRPFQHPARNKGKSVSTDYPSIDAVLSANVLSRSQTLPELSQPESPTQERPGWLPAIRPQEGPPPRGFTPLQWELVQASRDRTLLTTRAPRVPRAHRPVGPATYLVPRPHVSEMFRGLFGVAGRPQSSVRRNSVGTYYSPPDSTQTAADSGASERNATPRLRRRDALENLSAELVRGIKAVTKDM